MASRARSSVVTGIPYGTAADRDRPIDMPGMDGMSGSTPGDRPTGSATWHCTAPRGVPMNRL